MDILDHAPSTPKLANFGQRLAAILLDGIIMSIITTPIMFAFMGSLMGSMATIDMENPENIEQIDTSGIMTAFLVIYVLIPLLYVLYQAIFESSKYQATPGKMVAKIKVTDMDGQRASFLRCVGRNAARILSSAILMIGYLMPLWTEKRQALHDMIASTLVVEK